MAGAESPRVVGQASQSARRPVRDLFGGVRRWTAGCSAVHAELGDRSSWFGPRARVVAGARAALRERGVARGHGPGYRAHNWQESFLSISSTRGLRGNPAALPRESDLHPRSVLSVLTLLLIALLAPCGPSAHADAPSATFTK